MKSRAKRDPDGRKQAIIEAAAQIIAEQGVTGASHRRIAERAAVPLGATTQYFASREELIHAALASMAAQLDQDLAALAEDLASGDEATRTVARHFLSYAEDDHRSQAATAFFLSDLQSPGVRDLTQHWYSRQSEVLRDRFGERFAQAAGTYAYGLFIQYAQREPLPTEEDVVWVLDRLATSG